MVARTSLAAYCWFSPTIHSHKVAVSAPAATSGMRSSSGITLPDHLLQFGGHFLGAGVSPTFEPLADAGHPPPPPDALEGRAQPVEQAALYLVGEPSTVGG